MTHHIKSYLLLALEVSLIRNVASVEDLYMIGLFPFHGSWHGGAAQLAGCEMALKQVNERDDVLPNYRLNLLWNDTRCHPGLGLNIMFNHLYNPPIKIMIIGGACSIVSQATAQVSYMWNVVQLAPGTVSPALSDKNRFKKYLRIASPDSDTNPAQMELFRSFGWTHISTIHQPFEMFSVAIDQLIRLMKEANMTLVTSEIVTVDPSIQVLKLKERGARIIVGSFYADMAIKILCEAYKIGLYGPNIVWLLRGWYSNFWWKEKDSLVDCTSEQIENVIDGYFSIKRMLINPKAEVTISGQTPAEIQEMYSNWTNNEPLTSLTSGFTGYDAIWAAALALNKTMTDLESKGSERLEDFTYDNVEMGELLFNNAMSTEFVGVRGEISFNEYGDLNSIYKVYRFQGGKKQMVGLFYPKQFPTSIEWIKNTPVLWKDGRIPKDSVTLKHIQMRLSPTLYIVICIVSAMGFVLTCAFLAFNIGYRKSKFVKMSSPNLNNITLVGCLVLYGSVFWEGGDTSNFVIFCQGKLVSLTVGFSLAFGGLFAKTWRVYLIFTHGTKQRKIIKDKQLLAMVCGLVTINISIIIIWFVIDPFQIVIQKLYTEINIKDDIEIRRTIEHCESPKQTYFMGSLFTLQGIILLFGVFLALQTRKVKIDGLNDSKMIGVCIYNVVVLSFLGVMVSLTLKSDVDLNYGISSCIIILATTVTQCLIVIPKMRGHLNPSQVEDTAVRNVSTVSGINESYQRTGNTPTVNNGLNVTLPDCVR